MNSPFNLNVLIVEDNFSFALDLEILLQELNYNVLAVVDNSAEALEVIFSESPDLILMDIQIKGNLTGVEIGQKIKHLQIPILYITSMKDTNYYQAAQDSNLIGYLIKPVEKFTLRTTIQLAVEKAYHLQQQQATPQEEPSENFISNDRFFFKKLGTYYKVKIPEIAFIKAHDNYCETTTLNKETFTPRITLGKFEQLLPSEQFMRIHRQYIVQIEEIEAIDFINGILTVLGHKIPISRSKRKEIEMMIRKME